MTIEVMTVRDFWNRNKFYIWNGLFFAAMFFALYLDSRGLA